MENIKLKSAIDNQKTESALKEKNLEENYKNQLKLKDDQIDYYKDMKARQSTKMVGESLEQHCQNQFNSLRMTAFPNAYFEKDNQVSESGSKGDFIFREADPEGGLCLAEGIGEAEGVYDLNGRRVTETGNRKGIYIIKRKDKTTKVIR